MSIFKARDWWEVYLNESNSYNLRSLLTLKLDSDEYYSIILGNHNGFLRLYSPSAKFINGEVSGYQPSNLLLEIQLPFPILQVDEGVLVSGSLEKQLAILHPRIFSVYSVKKKETSDNKVGDQIILELIYQHVLQHSAHSFALGSFGGVKGRSFTCIQSLDGLLSFYEQESFAFQLYLPNFLLPNAFAYITKIDSFLFLNGYLTIDCFSYESLASASREKKISKKWEYNLGEDIIDFQAVSKNELAVIILSERSIYGLNNNGNLLFTKHLECKPMAFCTFLTEEERLMIVVATERQFINLYEDTRLKWSMKIDQTPICVKRIFLNELPGGLLLLSEDGLLQCTYIGTHPSLYIISSFLETNIEVLKAEAELNDLHNKITSNDLLNPCANDHVNIEMKIDGPLKIENQTKMCNLLVYVESRFFINRLQVLIHVEPPLYSENSNSFLTNFSGKINFERNIFIEGHEIPWNLEVLVTVTYVTNEGVGKCITKQETLPLSLVLLETNPMKEAKHKFTITTNKPTIDIKNLFKEFCNENTVPNAVGLKFTNSDEIITILAGKFSSRYRIQSNLLPSITIPFLAMIEKLRKQFRKCSDLNLTYCTPMPLEIYNEVVLNHQKLTITKKNLEQKLMKETSQFKTIQKKVLSNFKDATPKTSSYFFKLSEETWKAALSTVKELEEIEKQVKLSKYSICALNQLLSVLLELSCLQKDHSKLIKCVFNPFIYETDDQEWLEVQEATLLFFLREVLTKSVREKSITLNAGLIKDTNKLTKHITTFIEKILKHSLKRQEQSKYNIKRESLSNDEDEENFFDEVTAAGSDFQGSTDTENLK